MSRSNGVSVIVCTYNGARRIRATLEALSRCSTRFPVELVLVDNNSSDGTAEIAQRSWRETANSKVEFTVVRESKPGLSVARKRGRIIATQELLLYCDDDNWLEADYLIMAQEIMEKHPEVGVLGGESVPFFESEPPAWFLENCHLFAIGNQGESEGDITETRGWVWGAGMVVRASALKELDTVGAEFVALGRSGSKMTSGEDSEVCLYLRELGWRIWYSPRLKLRHYMPQSRFDWKKYRALTFHNGVFNATFSYAFASGRGRVWTVLSLINAFLRPRFRRTGGSDIIGDMSYLAGNLYGFMVEAKKIARVHENMRKLKAARASKLRQLCG